MFNVKVERKGTGCVDNFPDGYGSGGRMWFWLQNYSQSATKKENIRKIRVMEVTVNIDGVRIGAACIW